MQADFFARKRRNSFFLVLGLLAVTYGSIFITQYDVVKGLTSIPRAIEWSFANFYPNEAAMEKLPNILEKLLETVLMSIAASTIAALVAIPFALFGSHTTKVNGVLSVISRGIATLFRNIDVAAWSMILLFAFGQTTLTGLFALFFVSFGFLTRTFIETIDEASTSSVEALRATGASYAAIIKSSVLPSSAPQMISWLLFMIETNIRSATLVGILTGTGIGFSFNLYYKSLNYNAASLVVIVIVISILAIEYISNYIRRVIL